MTILPDWEIRWRCEHFGDTHGGPLIDKFDKDFLQPSSYDVRLDSTVLIPNTRVTHPIDTREPAEDRTEPVDISKNGFILTQGRFVLGATIEWVNIHNDLVGRIEGKSSRARQGIQIHSAGYLDPGFCGNVTLEIVNFSSDPIVLWPDILIAQLSFEKLTGNPEQPYSSKRNHYQNSRGAIGSRYGQNIQGE